MSHVVRYRVPEAHHATTIKGDQELHGSVHHEAETEFTGLVTRSHPDGSHDIVIFPPDKAPRHVHKVKAGEGPDSVTLIGFAAPAKTAIPAAH